jgi:hypothetical protein
MNALLLPLLLIATAPSGQAAATSAAGTYVGDLLGLRFEVVLHPDGRATAAGQPAARWLQRGTSVTFTDQDGTVEHGRLDGNRLIVTLDGVEMVLERHGPAAAPAPAPTAPGSPPIPASGSGCAPPATAPKLLPGVKHTVPGAAVSFRLPKGWSGKWIRVGKEAVSYHLSGPLGAGGYAFVNEFLRTPAQQALPMAEAVEALARELADESTGYERTGLETLKMGGHCGVRVRFRSGGFEGNVLGVPTGEWLYLLAARYPEASAAVVRPAFDTMAATLGLSPPSRNSGLERQVLGCWNRTGSLGSGYGSYHGEGGTLRLDSEGNYVSTSHMYVSTPGGSLLNKEEERGSFRVLGNDLVTVTSEGFSERRPIGMSGGVLQLGNGRYLPCR